MPSAETSEAVQAASRVRLTLLLWLAGMAALAYLCRNSISVVQKSIRSDLQLTESQLGFILGPAFFWTYALAQIPSARLGERLGPRIGLACFAGAWSLAIALFACTNWFPGSLAMALFGDTNWFPLLLGIWMVTGLAQAGAFPVAARTISVWFPKSERAMASGALTAAMSLGAAISAGLTGWLVLSIPWQIVFLLYAVPGIAWGIGFSKWFRNRPESQPGVNAAELLRIGEGNEHAATPAISEATPWLPLVTSWPMWMICGQQFCRAAAQAFFISWFPTFLQESRHITVTQSGFLSILPHLSIAAACLSGGGLADFIYRKSGRLGWSRKGLAVVSLTLSTALIGAAYFVHDATGAVVVISIGIYCAALAGPGSYAVTMDMGGRHVGSVFATMNMIGNFGAGVLPWLIPALRAWVNANPVLLDACAHDSWNAVIILIALLHLLAAICWLVLPLRGTIFDYSMIPPVSQSE